MPTAIQDIWQNVYEPFSKSLKFSYVFSKEIRWTTDSDFNKGTNLNTEVKGTGETTYVALIEKADNSDNVPFTIPSDYTYDNSKIEVTGGVARLKSTSIATYDWTFTTPSDYTYNASLIEVTGSVAKLKGIPITPYAWWHLNEAAGANIADSSGNGRNGTTVGSPSWVAAKLNNGLQTTGTQYGNMGDIASFERTIPFSVEMWIKTASTGTLIGRRENSAPYRGWDIMFSGGNLYFYFANTTVSNMISVYTTFALGDNAWHHVVVTYDGSSNASGVNIYIDGALKSKTTQYNTLSATAITTTYLHLGARAGANYLNGTYDEVVIYSTAISAANVTERYNSGTGTETMIGSYSLTNPPIYPNTGYVFVNPSNFVETATKPSGSAIKYHCSSDNGITWKYWNGSAWVVTDNSYTQANITSDIATNINSLAPSGTFNFRALLHSDTGIVTPELDNIRFEGGAMYPTGNYDISMNTDIQPTNNYAYLTTTETVIKPTNTDLKYKYSTNSGFIYNGSWLTNAQLQTALQGITCIGDGSDKIRFKFQLSSSDVNVTPSIDNLNITSDAGYKTSGTYTSNSYNSGYVDLDWNKITYDIILPVGTTATFKIRTSIDGTNWNAWSSAYASGEEIVENGQYIQWKCDLTGPGIITPRINNTSIFYISPVIQVVNP